MAKKEKTKPKSDLNQTKEYIKFLEKAMSSLNFKNNDPEKFKLNKEKLDKARLKLRLLEGKL